MNSITFLNLNDNSISDLSGLSSLTKLTELLLNGNAVADVSALAGLQNLETLDLSYNHNLSGVSSLSG